MFTVSYKTKQADWLVSQYPSTQHKITNVNHLFQWRNIKHTAETWKRKR